MNPIVSLCLTVALMVATGSLATAADAERTQQPKDAASAAPAGSMTDGEVRKVDKENKKLTLKHGEIKNLDMPSMTMVFQVQDSALLERFKAGDKVRFRAEKVGGAYTVVAIEAAQ
jgi:Cu(I)/Ag(I) efflux system periplasmic protein CusF